MRFLRLVQFAASIGSALAVLPIEPPSTGASVAAAPPAVEQSGCVPLAGADAILASDREGAPPAKGTVLMLGEIHGTAEAPEAVERLVCDAVARGLPVTVGLEIPAVESTRLEAFFAIPSPHTTRSGIDDLIAGPFWQREYQDGRSSAAMLELLVDLRVLDAGRGLVRVIFFDVPEAGTGRDRAMARRLAEGLAPPLERFAVILTGNLHNRMTVGTPFDRSREPMGFLLAAARPDLHIVSLNLIHSGGTAWTCTSGAVSDCAARPLRGRPGEAGIRLGAIGEEPGPYHGTLQLGTITASEPARENRGNGRESTDP